jgi:acetyl-CoA/propionyl-CoA carboxylase biotin carboxyl carrier protein
MKMEHQLLAPLDGTVHLTTRPGDLVKADQVLATIHPHPAAESTNPTDTTANRDATPDTDATGKGA